MDRIEKATREFPSRLKVIIKEYGDDYLTLSQILGVSERTIRRMLTGDALPTYEEILALYFEYGESLEWLMGISDKR